MTRREVLLGTLIAVICLFFAVEFMKYLVSQQKKGNDALRVNTAESVSLVNSNNGMNCPVNGCGRSDKLCVHYKAGRYIGYFDDVSNSIVGELPYGYNEYKTMKVDDGRTWSGKPGTMVIQVAVSGFSDIDITWELGRQ